MAPPESTRGSVASLVLVAAAVAVLVAAAALLFAAPAAPTGERIGADASEEFDAVDGLTATRTTVVERGDRTSETVAAVALRPGTDRRRTELLDGDRQHAVTASNGSVLWLYDEDADAVTRVPLAETPPGEATAGDRVERLFAALNVTRPTASASATVEGPVAALPVVPEANGATDAPSATNARVGVTYEGTGAVDGREAYVLRIEPAASGAFEQTLWVDRETFFPLQRETSWSDDGTPVTVTTTYENVTVNPGLDADTFQFDAPADATVETLETPETTAFDGVADLRAATDAPVPALDLPPSFRLTYATETTGRVHGAGVRYANETALVTAATYNRTAPVDGDRTVSVHGREAVVDTGPTTSVSWNCDDYRYTVRGRGVTADFLVSVARGVDCE
ncbi:LolA family protein [Halobacterium yunchengense]|uniref:LolA family protein n=1 Tax=Halobacterium yunchengense TaxID=3108497 RepID=UPI00300B59FF